jgi:hypothetical protein
MSQAARGEPTVHPTTEPRREMPRLSFSPPCFFGATVLSASSRYSRYIIPFLNSSNG